MFKLFFSKNFSYGTIASIIFLLLYFLIYIIQGQNAVITVHDNLDSELLFRKILSNAGVLFDFSNSTIVPQIMNGLKRNCFNASSFNVISFLFYLFPTFWAYMINFILVKTIGFAGMLLLLRKYILQNEKHTRLISGILALSFILLPSYTMFGVTITGLPLLIYSILNILEHRNIISAYLFIILYPFYSSLVLSGYAVIVIIALIAIYFLFKKDLRYKPLFKIVAIISVLFIISEINLINQLLFDKNYLSHRLTWGFENYYNFKKAVYKAIIFFITGHYHSPSSHLFILLFCITVFVLKFKLLIKNRIIIISLLFLVLASVLLSFANWNIMIVIVKKITILKMFHFQRFYMISIVIWYLLFGILIKIILSNKSRRSYYFIYFFLFLNLGFVLFSNQELKQNLYNLFVKKSFITYKEYYSEKLFNKVKDKIGLPQDKYKIVSLGLYPAITQYNGFYTLDSYQAIYDLKYKIKFREIISGELDKSPALKTYFDNWGCRCYIFSSELKTDFYVTNKESINELRINTGVLKDLGCDYIISAVEIKNAQAINLSFVDKITDNESQLTIYLYKV